MYGEQKKIKYDLWPDKWQVYDSGLNSTSMTIFIRGFGFKSESINQP